MKIKKLILTLINVISVLMIAVAVFAPVTVLFTPAGEAPTVFGWQILRITTGSMAPTYPTDTMVFVRKTDPADLPVPENPLRPAPGMRHRARRAPDRVLHLLP